MRNFWGRDLKWKFHFYVIFYILFERYTYFFGEEQRTLKGENLKPWALNEQSQVTQEWK